jgi:predicted SAM-dependent methyltransferase
MVTLSLSGGTMRAQLKSTIKSSLLIISRACRTVGFAKFQARNGFTSRQALLARLHTGSSVLEIGPFDQPVMRGPNVKYFDVMDQQGLIARARACGRRVEGCPRIDYVSDRGDLSVVTGEKFDSVISSHCIEHQPNLIRHLNQVFDVLRPGGKYYVIVPDKRFIFDHYLPLTRVSDVLAAHAEAREVHTPASIITHYAETTHNSPLRHWLGFHRPLRTTAPYVERLRAALELVSIRSADYVDVHCWCFTPPSLVDVLKTLSEMNMIGFRIDLVYGTPFGSNEFFAVLHKTPNG